MTFKQCSSAFAQPILQLALLAAVVFGVAPVHANLAGEVCLMAGMLACMVVLDGVFVVKTEQRLELTHFRRLLVQETGFQVLAVFFVVMAGLCAVVTLIAHTTTGPMVCLVPISLLSASFNIYRAAVARRETMEIIDEASCFFRVA